MCYPLAKEVVHVVAACYKNRYKNICVYHLRANLSSQLLKSNAVTLDLLGSREWHLKLSCQVLSLSYMKKNEGFSINLCASPCLELLSWKARKVHRRDFPHASKVHKLESFKQ